MTLLAIITMCVLALGVDAVPAHAQGTLQFAGADYRLAFVDVAKGGEITNEYIPPGETLKNWTTLLGVRWWPKRSDAMQTATAWVNFVRPHTFKKAEILPRERTAPADDVIVEVWLIPPDKSYLEANLHRFVVEPGTTGVKAYQFAERMPMNPRYGGDITSFWNRRQEALDALRALSVPVRSER